MRRKCIQAPQTMAVAASYLLVSRRRSEYVNERRVVVLFFISDKVSRKYKSFITLGPFWFVVQPWELLA